MPLFRHRTCSILSAASLYRHCHPGKEHGLLNGSPPSLHPQPHQDHCNKCMLCTCSPSATPTALTAVFPKLSFLHLLCCDPLPTPPLPTFLQVTHLSHIVMHSHKHKLPLLYTGAHRHRHTVTLICTLSSLSLLRTPHTHTNSHTNYYYSNYNHQTLQTLHMGIMSKCTIYSLS